MAVVFENSLSSLSELDLWYKLQTGETLKLSDVPEIINLRWNYFRDNWEKIRQRYVESISTYPDSDLLRTHIDTFSEFVASQRASMSSRNPFDSDNIIIRFYTIFDTTDLNSVQLSFEERKIIDEKKRRIGAYTRGNFLEIREQLKAERDNIADKVGTTDPDYNRIFNRSSQPARVDIRNRDINRMHELQEAIKSVDFILANSFSLEENIVDPFALARQNANNPEIDIPTYFSGQLVKLNYEESLQSLANRTLGDPNKWIDIAITNGLKPPYIDEVGEKIPLISNASGNQLNIAETNVDNEFNSDKLSVGQILLLQSDVETFPEQRVIGNIREVPVSGEIILELEGEPNLDRYKVSENAHIRIFKPNTVNSSFLVMIPSLTEIEDTLENDIPWFLKGKDGVEKRQKVDLNIGENGDLSFGPTGDLQLSFGLTNAIQAVRLKMSVELGELRRHSDFGLPPVVGLKNTQVGNVRKILTDSINRMISEDERFSTIERLDVAYRGKANNTAPSLVSVDLIVRLAGTGQLIPINFEVNI